MSWQHFSEVRSLVQGTTPDRWQRIAVLMVAHGGQDDPAARTYMRTVLDRLPVHERPCRIVVSAGGSNPIAKLKNADIAVVPGAAALDRVKSFSHYATGPLYGGINQDFSGPTPIARALLASHACGILMCVKAARAVTDHGVDHDRREAVLSACEQLASAHQLAVDGFDEAKVKKGLYCGLHSARAFMSHMFQADRNASVGSDVSLESVTHERRAFARCVNLLGMLKIPTAIGCLSACGITAMTGCVEYAWGEDAKYTVPALFNEGQLLRHCHTYAKPHKQGYPMPSADVDGPTEWIKTQGDPT